MGRGGAASFGVAAVATAALACAAAPADAFLAGDLLLISAQPSGGGFLDFSAGVSRIRDGSADGSSQQVVSSDGRYVAFVSRADGLSDADDDAVQNVYVRDMQTDGIEVASVTDGELPATADSRGPSLSDDGRRVAFHTDARLDPADTNGGTDIYVRDLTLGTTELVSRDTGTATPANGDAFGAWISGDGNVVSFSTNLDLGAGDTDALTDVFVRVLATDTTELVSLRTDDSQETTNVVFGGSLDETGDKVALYTISSLGVPGDTNSTTDVFVRQRSSGGSTVLASAKNGMTTASAAGSASNPMITDDGTKLAFQSNANDLHIDDSDSLTDVYIRRLGSNTTIFMSRATGGTGANTDMAAVLRSINDSEDVVFETVAKNVVSPPEDTFDADLFVRDTTTTTPLSVVDGSVSTLATGGVLQSEAGSISDDGEYVVFVSQANDMRSDDDDQDTHVYRRWIELEATDWVDRPPGFGGGGFGPSYLRSRRSVSADGRYVAFLSEADGLLPPGANKDQGHVFVRDTVANTTELVDRKADGTPGSGTVGYVSISADGRVVAFDTDEGLVPGDGADRDVYLRDLAAGAMERVSVATGGAGGNGGSGEPVISADGRFVAFSSGATNLDPADNASGQDIFVRDRTAGTTTLVSRRADGMAVNSASAPDISADGSRVAYTTVQQIAPGDTDGRNDIVVRTLGTGSNVLGSRPSAAETAGAWEFYGPLLSGDGGRVAFSTSMNQAALVADVDGSGEPVVASRASGPTGTPSDRASAEGLSDDGRFVLFFADASDIAPDLAPPQDLSYPAEVFLRDLVTETTTLVGRGPGPTGKTMRRLHDYAALSGGANRAVFDSLTGGVLPGGPSGDGLVNLFARVLVDDPVPIAEPPPGPDGGGARARPRCAQRPRPPRRRGAVALAAADARRAAADGARRPGAATAAHAGRDDAALHAVGAGHGDDRGPARALRPTPRPPLRQAVAPPAPGAALPADQAGRPAHAPEPRRRPPFGALHRPPRAAARSPLAATASS